MPKRNSDSATSLGQTSADESWVLGESVPVLYQDDQVLVINKPAGLIVEKSHTHNQTTLQDILVEGQDLDRGGLVHRLDRDTSGVMVVAKTAEAQSALQQQFLERQTDKEYLALVWGKLADDHAVIKAPIARHPRVGHKFVVMEGGREATTEFWRLAEYQLGDEVVSLIRVVLHTGRTHQIRVHMMALGHALVGDSVYGRRKDKTGMRQFLQASKLGFSHPSTGEAMMFEVPLAEDLQQFVDGLAKVD